MSKIKGRPNSGLAVSYRTVQNIVQHAIEKEGMQESFLCSARPSPCDLCSQNSGHVDNGLIVHQLLTLASIYSQDKTAFVCAWFTIRSIFFSVYERPKDSAPVCKELSLTLLAHAKGGGTTNRNINP